ncbi:MAG: ABC transporter substrate-binding protein [Flavobacteriales bacterium]|nr:ABC transporter substrate-binding protein [Flavobacteriales bacterium]
MNQTKIRVSAVSYLNTIPFIHGIENSPALLEQIELSRDIPSECARKLMSGEVDLGLVPVAILPQMDESFIVTDFCIGAVGEVSSVLLFSDVPLEEIEEVYLDYQSRTSVQLCHILCREYWKITPKFIKAEPGFESKIKDKTAGLVIGDRCFGMKGKHKYQYDLSKEWYDWKKLPFVFAVWLSRSELSKSFEQEFNTALQNGLGDLIGAIKKYPYEGLSHDELLAYLEKSIDYHLDDDKVKGLNEFLAALESRV